MTDRPEIRVKRLEDDEIRVTRIAEPIMHAEKNIVDVHYNIFIEDKVTGSVEVIKENHQMRYLFDQELSSILSHQRLEVLNSFEFMTTKSLDYNTWNACYLVKPC